METFSYSFFKDNYNIISYLGISIFIYIYIYIFIYIYIYIYHILVGIRERDALKIDKEKGREKI